MKGVVLLNLGTPRSPSPQHVGEYLKEFLMDPLVIDIPEFFRWIMVNVFIVPKRSHASSELYKKIWTDRGSPLLFHTLDLTRKVQARMADDALVAYCMRYGQPSIADTLRYFQKKHIEEILLIPLYPQYSLAATESSILRVREVLGNLRYFPSLEIVPAFYNTDWYLEAVTKVSAPHVQSFNYDKVLFSFHGLPERQVKKTDKSHAYCLEKDGCCEMPSPQNKDCYRFQSYQTAHALAKRLGIPKEKYLIAFQSRLGRTPWIKPYTDMYYETLPKEGVKNLLVISPSFVADCLETLEEVTIRGQKQFQENGGNELRLVPSLNSEDVWADALVKRIQEFI